LHRTQGSYCQFSLSETANGANSNVYLDIIEQQLSIVIHLLACLQVEK